MRIVAPTRFELRKLASSIDRVTAPSPTQRIESLAIPRERSFRTAEKIAAGLGSALVVVALLIIWLARLSIPRAMYVSELGAQGEKTAGWFELALLLIVVAGVLIGWSARRLRSSLRILSFWTPAISLWIGSSFFLVASQVTCTLTCPIPYGPEFTWQDFIHTNCAVLAFAFACLAMLQCAFAAGHKALRVFSMTACILVALIAGLGGILSLAHFATDFGSACELVATTIALAWLGVLGVYLISQRTTAEPDAG